MFNAQQRFPLPPLPLAAVGILLGFMAFSPAAQAACSYPATRQVFAPWQDLAYYQLIPNGGLESGSTGWTLEGGAKLVPGNESRMLNSATDATSLSVPYGATATSPPVCVDATTPVFRLMTLNSGKRDAKLRVTVIYEGAKSSKANVTEIQASNVWEPSQPLKFEIAHETERVARIRFSPKEGEGAWLVDDVYIDPFARR